MGYTTEFEGSIAISPPLSPEEIAFLTKFSRTRRMKRTKGPYFVNGTGEFGQNQDADVLDSNGPPDGQPGLWCQWTPDELGTRIEWDGGEKFYESEAWMRYLVEHFIGSAPIAAKELPFLTGHVLSGVIEAQGEDSDDHYWIIVENDAVSVIEGHRNGISGHERALIERISNPT